MRIIAQLTADKVAAQLLPNLYVAECQQRCLVHVIVECRCDVGVLLDIFLIGIWCRVHYVWWDRVWRLESEPVVILRRSFWNSVLVPVQWVVCEVLDSVNVVPGDDYRV